MRRRLLFTILLCFSVLLSSGCKNDDTNSSIDANSKQQTDSEQIQSSKVSTDESTSSTFTGFTDDEIESAKKEAIKYYKNTIFNIESIECDLTNSFYKTYSKEYKKGHLITFTVKIAKSDNPPREIVLIRENLNSNWKVLTEGY